MSMNIIDTVAAMQRYASAWHQQGLRIGFVPTMGNLHAGHLSLVKKAQQVSDRVVVSIFVNPLQFDEMDDFAKYPRTLEADLDKLNILGVDAVFTPDEQALYPQGRETITHVEVPGLSTILEGEARPGHFVGVATVVCKLFNCVQPHVAVFGEKDFQQLLLIKRMIADLDMPVEIIGMPTEREADGLALSSRNGLLSAEQRQLAPALYQVLQQIREAILAGSSDYSRLEAEAEDRLRAGGFEPDYVAIRLVDNLAPASGSAGDKVILAAARVGETRLIDNLRI